MKSKNQFKDTLITVALVFENKTVEFENNIEILFRSLKKNFEYFEILIIDNHTGLNKNSIENICSSYPNIRCISLSRHVARETFYNALLENSLGDYVVIFDPSIYNTDVVTLLINKITEGYDMVMVNAKRPIKKGTIEKITFLGMNTIFKKVLGIEFRPQTRFNGVLGRAAVNSIIKVKNKKKFLRYSDYFIGLNMQTVPFPIIRKSLDYKVDSKEMVLSGIDVLISNSQFPLRMATLFGLGASFLSFLFLVYVIAVSLIKKRIIEGWITTSFVTGSLFLVLFLILTILSEYISRILSETKNEPLYFISKEIASITSRRKNRKNINVIKK